MLSYKISNPARPHRPANPTVHRRLKNRAVLQKQMQMQHEPGPDAYLSKSAILERHVEKCYFTVGEHVAYKKPRRNAPKGQIVEIIKDPHKVEWKAGGKVPLFLVVRINKVDPDTGVIYGFEDKLAGVKQLLFKGTA